MTQGMTLYNIRRGPHGFSLAKFDENLNLLAAYDVDPKYCSCPAGPRPTCRHRKMLPRMLSKVDTAEFYCYETQTWHQPLAAPADNVGSEAEAYGKMDTTYLEAAREINKFEREAVEAMAKEPPKVEREPIPAPAQPAASGGIRRR